jgi:hypothetical protein
MAISRVVNRQGVPIRITARSLLLVSSGVVRKCEKESTMAKFRKRMMKWGLASAKVGLATAAIMGVQTAMAGPITPVPAANQKVPGFSSPNVLSPEFQEVTVAQGSTPLENPSADTSRYYGYSNDGPMLPAPGDLPSPSHKVEASKTEPDKNTYLVLEGQHGAAPGYNYGSHFLFQGHELGLNNQGIITRINLDADGAHRVTLLAEKEQDGTPLLTIDGSTWYPFSRRLLFSSERGNGGGIYQATPDFPSVVENLFGVMGRGGYEGMQVDPAGNIIIIEDVGGRTGSTNSHARQPNSFIYRCVPKNLVDLKSGGKLQALQAMSLDHTGPIVFNAGNVDGDILSNDMRDLHTYGKVFDTQWVTIHDTDLQGFASFDANKLAKDAGATPFKRPENGQFRPGSEFREFYFDETGDTNALTEAVDHGGFGSIMKLTSQGLSGDKGKLTMVYKGDVQHTGFDNVAFLAPNKIVFVEDAGDSLHSQRNALDSAYVFDLRIDYSNSANQPVRVLALGRDPSATIDSAFLGMPGYQNDGDNEITGFYVSDGDPTREGLLGAKKPRLFRDGWRAFYTQQHGDNSTFEILPAKSEWGHDGGE